METSKAHPISHTCIIIKTHFMQHSQTFITLQHIFITHSRIGLQANVSLLIRCTTHDFKGCDFALFLSAGVAKALFVCKRVWGALKMLLCVNTVLLGNISMFIYEFQTCKCKQVEYDQCLFKKFIFYIKKIMDH